MESKKSITIHHNDKLFINTDGLILYRDSYGETFDLGYDPEIAINWFITEGVELTSEQIAFIKG